MVVACIALLLGILLPALSKSREAAKQSTCASNLRQIDLSSVVYVNEQRGLFPPRTNSKRWTTRLKPIYKDPTILRCPSDDANANSGEPDPVGNASPDDASPRTYLLNGWNDYFRETLSATAFDAYMMSSPGRSLPEKVMPKPSETVVFGEKITISDHFYLDWMVDYGDDAHNDLEQSRHGSSQSNTRPGGSNYALGDGSVRFLEYGKSLDPINLWATTETWRLYSGFSF